MIIQLPNGRIIECSVEQYLSLSDDEVKELYGLSSAYTKEVNDPFYNMFSKGRQAAEEDMEKEQDYEPDLNEIDSSEKLSDTYFHSDDV